VPHKQRGVNAFHQEGDEGRLMRRGDATY